MKNPSPAVGVAGTLPEVSALPVQSELPDPLRMLDGSKVDSAHDWRERRRPELLRLFEHYMYGYAPLGPVPMEFRVLAQGDALGGNARWRRVGVHVHTPAGVPTIELLLLLPARRAAPRATFLGLNFEGNHSLLADPVVPEPLCAALSAHGRVPRGGAAHAWDVERVLSRGYALAGIHTCDVKPDRPKPDEGIQHHFMPAGSEPDPHAWGTLRAWAWGLSRAVDYLVTDDDVGQRPIAVVGHSRLGKAAMVAAAFDERIALACVLQAGCGGSAPSRSNVGESVRNINTGFPHWFNAEFKKFNAEPARLPFDQHCLAALVAPRPLLFANAAEDTWANPVGQFEVLRAAQPVYALLGAGGLESQRLPAVGELSAGRLGYFLRPGTHSMTATDWAAFLDFADRHLGS
jgi:hypothetical protein